MAILLSYFAFVVTTLAVIVSAWIGVAESGAERLHLQRAGAIQQSYDASFMAEDSSHTALTRVATAKTKAPQVTANPTTRRWRPHVVRRLAPQPGPWSDAPRVALRGLAPPDDGH